MVKFNVSLSKKYFRISNLRNPGYWENTIIRTLMVLVFLPKFCYRLIEDGRFSFVLFIILLFWLIPLLLIIKDLPFVSAASARRKNIRYIVEISNEGMRINAFVDSEEVSKDYFLDKCILIIEHKDYFFLEFDERCEYLMKSDIVEGSVEEARMIFIGEAGKKFFGLKN